MRGCWAFLPVQCHFVAVLSFETLYFSGTFAGVINSSFSLFGFVLFRFISFRLYILHLSVYRYSFVVYTSMYKFIHQYVYMYTVFFFISTLVFLRPFSSKTFKWTFTLTLCTHARIEHSCTSLPQLCVKIFLLFIVWFGWNYDLHLNSYIFHGTDNKFLSLQNKYFYHSCHLKWHKMNLN